MSKQQAEINRLQWELGIVQNLQKETTAVKEKQQVEIEQLK